MFLPAIIFFFFSACYRSIERDYNLDQRIVRDTIRVTGLVKCQEACTDARLFNCRSFAFSSSLSASFNCYLSDRRASDLDNGLDLVRDFDSIVYERLAFCDHGGYRGRAEGTIHIYLRISDADFFINLVVLGYT